MSVLLNSVKSSRWGAFQVINFYKSCGAIQAPPHQHRQYLRCFSTTSIINQAKNSANGDEVARKLDHVSTSFDYEILTSSSELEEEEKRRQKDTDFISDMDILQEPSRERFGLLKSLAIIVLGVYAGAWLAMIGAHVLEDLEIFIDCEEDDN